MIHVVFPEGSVVQAGAGYLERPVLLSSHVVEVRGGNFDRETGCMTI